MTAEWAGGAKLAIETAGRALGALFLLVFFIFFAGWPKGLFVHRVTVVSKNNDDAF